MSAEIEKRYHQKRVHQEKIHQKDFMKKRFRQMHSVSLNDFFVVEMDSQTLLRNDEGGTCSLDVLVFVNGGGC